MNSVVPIHALLTRYSRVVLPRVGVGVGVGGGCGAIHASRLTSANPSLWITDRSVPDAWMALRAIGGGSV